MNLHKQIEEMNRSLEDAKVPHELRGMLGDLVYLEAEPSIVSSPKQSARRAAVLASEIASAASSSSIASTLHESATFLEQELSPVALPRDAEERQMGFGSTGGELLEEFSGLCTNMVPEFRGLAPVLRDVGSVIADYYNQRFRQSV